MDRLTAQDLMLIWPEELGWSQDIGALAILDSSGLHDSDGRFRIEIARDEIGRRLHQVPRFRQLLYQPSFGLGWPLWVDAPAFDVAEHVRVLPLAAQADEARLLLACEELRHRRLNRSRPLWEMWFLPGLPGGRVGMFIRCTTRLLTESPGSRRSARSSIPFLIPTRRSSHRGRRGPCRRLASYLRTTSAGAYRQPDALSARSPIRWKPSIRPRRPGRQCMRLSSKRGRRRQA